MFRSSLLRGASAGALTLSLLSAAAVAQEALPAIDIGVAQRPDGKAGKKAEDPKTYHPENASTATKTDTPIMETPVSIQVVPQQVLRDQQAISLARALDNVSGVRSRDDNAQGYTSFQIRGFNTNNYYTDGLRMSDDVTGRAIMVNAERIEVLKGPASILYGRAEPGGIVNIVTKKPLEKPQYSIEQLFGSWDTYRTAIDATGPLTEDGDLAYRVTALVENQHSFREFANPQNYFVSPVVRWRLDAATELTVNFRYLHQRTPVDSGTIAYTKYDPLSLVYGVGPVSSLPRGRNFGEPNSSTRLDNLMFGTNFVHHINDSWTITHRFEASLSDRLVRSVSPWGFDPINPTQLNRSAGYGSDRQSVYSTNLDIVGKFDTYGIGHTFLLGGDFLHWNIDKSQNYYLYNEENIDYINPVHSFTPTQLSMYPKENYYSYPGGVNWYGFFIQDQIRLPYNLFVLAGARYDRSVTKWGYEDAFTPLSYTLGDNSQRVTPRFGLLWRPIEEVSLYGSYTENFGAVNGLSGPRGKPLPPQSAQQWEVGVKTELFDKRLTATIAYFYLMKQHIPAPDPDPGLAAQGYVVAVGEVRNKGLEFDVAGEVSPGLKVIGNYTYIDSLVTKDNGLIYNWYTGELAGVNGFSGFANPNISRHMGGLWATYEFQDGDLKGLKFGGGANARSKSYADLFNSFHVPGYATVGLMTAYDWSVNGVKLTAQLNVDNLLDTRYYPEAFGPLSVFVGQPRTFKGSLRMAF